MRAAKKKGRSADRRRPVVCDRCFADKYLIEMIRSEGKRGRCPWCGSRKARVLHLSELTPLFRQLVGTYVQTYDIDRGDTIEQLIQDDWGIFSEAIAVTQDRRMRDLVQQILWFGYHAKDDVDLPNYAELFRDGGNTLWDEWHEHAAAVLLGDAADAMATEAPSEDEEGDRSDYWYVDRLEVAFEDLDAHLDKGTRFARARIHDDPLQGDRFAPADLGAPPADKARAGRCNRKGRSVLYLASDPETALREVRPWRGAAVAVAPVTLLRDVRVVDLTQPRLFDSPFELSEENIGWKIQLQGLLFRLAEEMSTPVIGREDLFYRPTQYLCERAEAARYDGVVYPSAVGPGHNVVLFDPSVAQADALQYMRILDVDVRQESLRDQEAPYQFGFYEDELRLGHGH